jgi:hypothetical protein
MKADSTAAAIQLFNTRHPDYWNKTIVDYQEIPSDYIQPAGEHPLVDAVLVEDEFVRFKVRLSLSSAVCKTFEEGVERLLDEIGPRPGTHPEFARIHRTTALIQCDAEEPNLPDSRRGIVEFGVNSQELPDDAGLPLILAIGSYVSAYSYIFEYNLMDVHLPSRILDTARYPGPKFGHSFIPSSNATRLGVIIKPRFISDMDFLRELVTDVGYSEVEYITDDELTVGSSMVPFSRRVQAVVGALQAVERSTGRKPAYIANIAGDSHGALKRAKIAKELGVEGVMVNSFTMGQDVISELASDPDFGLGIVANGMGLGILTKGPQFRMSTELLVRLTRLSGADLVYTGPIVGLIDSSQHSVAQFRRALTHPYGRGCHRPASGAMMSGGVGLPELLKNALAYRGPLFLSMGYQFAETRLKGIPGPMIVKCIRDVWEAVKQGGVDKGRETVQSLAKKGKKYRQCLAAIRAEEAVSN